MKIQNVLLLVHVVLFYHESVAAPLYTRCYFHQYFTSSFFVHLKRQFFVLVGRLYKFLAEKNWKKTALKMFVKLTKATKFSSIFRKEVSLLPNISSTFTLFHVNKVFKKL
jgi:hypothetical protein